jgi:hypothetical protein
MSDSQKRTDWRTAHGAAAACGALVVLENPRDRDLPPASPTVTDGPDRDESGRFVPGNSIARRRKARVGITGALHALEATATPEWQAVRRAGRRAARHRIGEFALAHGADLSSGVCGLIYEAAEMRADAAYLRARAAADNNPDLLKLAAAISTSARQSERDAWEFAVREAEARGSVEDQELARKRAEFNASLERK